MKKNILYIAVHPDDETLGCGGTILKAKKEGSQVSWLIVTEAKEENGFSKESIETRKKEIEQVEDLYGFDKTYELNLPTTLLDTLPLRDIISQIGSVIAEHKPDTLYIPHNGDVHSDHGVVFKAAWSCTKSFRYPSVKEVYVYETLSETEFAVPVAHSAFLPNTFSDISDTFDQKIKIMKTYKSEIKPHPFPRSEESLKALATLRGSTAGVKYAESFMCLKKVF